jgi:hypothetical protein
LRYSDAKHPQTDNGKKAIQNAIKSASEQKVEEVVIRLKRDYPSTEIYEGLKVALQPERAKTIQEIILIRKNGSTGKPGWKNFRRRVSLV